MTKETTTTSEATEAFGPFGEVFAELMRTRGLGADAETVRTLALDAGVDPDDLEREMYVRGREPGRLLTIAGDTHAVAYVLCLTVPEMEVMGLAFAYRKGDAAAVHEARGKPEHADEGEGSRDYPAGLSRPLVRYLDASRATPPCWVGATPAGGRCPNRATMRVYGKPFCEVHGAEIADGAREELYQDAADRLDSVADADAPDANPVVVAAVARARLRAMDATNAAADHAELLLMATFPGPPEVEDKEVAHYYAGLDPDAPDYMDTLLTARHNLHALLRTAYGRGETGLVETLESERQTIAALAAYAAEMRDGRYPERLEEARRSEREAPELPA